MYNSISLIVTESPLLLSIFCGLIVSSILLILFIEGRNNSKKLQNNEQLLKAEIAQLQKDLLQKEDSLEEKINLRNKKLIDEIENRKSIEIDHRIALKKSEEASFLKNAFMANMSLEIRTPLNGIIGFSRLLLGEIENLEKPELNDFANSIIESSDRLLNLIDHIIDLSRFETNDFEINIKAFEVNTIVSECLERFKNSAFEKNLILEFDQQDIFVAKGDKTAFSKSIDLILDNAVKYTLEGKITITLNADADDDKIHLLISDTGIGIDKNFLSDIFQAFRQKSTGYSRIQQGAGLGLPLAKKLMLLNQGDIQLKTEKGKGTEVLLTLLLAENIQLIAENGILQVENKESIDQTKKTLPYVFIVEDDKMNRLLFKKILSVFAEIKMAIDGDDAFIQLEKAIKSGEIFDIILLDINLPAPWDGMILLKEFKKKWPILNKIPFVAQTAYANSGDKEKFLAFGFDDYISKPIDKKELFTIIENNLRKFATQKKQTL